MLAAVLSLALPQDEHTKAWLEALTKVARTEHASLCVDVDEVAVPATFHYPQPDGFRGLDRLATAIARARTLVEGVHVFRRKPDEDDLRLAPPHAHVAAALQTLSALELTRLAKEGLALSSLPSLAQRRLRHALASVGGGIGDSMLAHYPDQVGMRLTLEPVAYVASRTGEGQVRLELLEERPKTQFPEKPDTTVPAPLGRPEDGAVDFGNGEILSLHDVIAKAERALGVRMWFDGRLAQTKLFLSGAFTEKRLLAVLASVTEPFPVTVQQPGFGQSDLTSERTKLIAQAFGERGAEAVGVAGLTFGDLSLGKATTFKALFGTRPPQRVQAFMAQYRIQPDDSITVNGDLSLNLAAPGMATLTAKETDSIGRPIPYSLPHYIRFGF